MSEITIFSADPYVIEFIRGNWLSLSMFLALLKGLAVLTKGVHDDKIVTLLQTVLGMGRSSRPTSGVTIDRPLGD